MRTHHSDSEQIVNCITLLRLFRNEYSPDCQGYYNAGMETDIDLLAAFCSDYESLAVLTGAGVSTASGIPDYRDRNGQSKNAQPIQYSDFMRSDTCRKRYWARSLAGWQWFAEAQPNGAHAALSRLESAGTINTLVTQNVDGLHSAAGSRQVVELHGALRKVRCMSCHSTFDRADFQQRLVKSNPEFTGDILQPKPDGDAELHADSYRGLNIPACRQCGGVIKPDVVMFGESVPKARVERAMEAVEQSDGLLVIGSSLMVFSGYRFARRASELQKPIAIVNHGKTRADDMATLKIDNDCVALLNALASSAST